jgi:hypothetical protein
MNQQDKEALYQKCVQMIENQIFLAQQGIENAQQAANEETKSSAGDKYETTRAMMQIEIENCSKRLAESQKLYNTLQNISFLKNYTSSISGSLLITTQGNYFLAVGIGKIEVQGNNYFVISPMSPIGALLQNKKVGEQVSFQNKKIEILQIV